MEEKMKSVISQTGLSEKAIRFYIEKGLVHPIERASLNRRNFFFDEVQIKRLKEITLLRKYDFSLKEIKSLYDEQSCIQIILDDYIKRIYNKCSYYSSITGYIQHLNAYSVDNIDALLKLMYDMEDTDKANETDFMIFDEKIDELPAPRLRISKIYIGLLLFSVILFLLLGIWTGCKWEKGHLLRRDNVIKYGIYEQNLTVQSVLWEDYPGFRKLSFVLDGTVAFHAKPNGALILNNLTNIEAFKAVDREHMVLSNGTDLSYYDDVTYSINNGIVRVSIPKVYSDNPIIYSVRNSFYLAFSEKDADYIAGSIRFLDIDYTAWTEKEAEYSDMDIDAYLSAFTLSGTYDNINPLHEKNKKDEIILRKEEGDFLNCTIYNNSKENWSYEAQPPHIELWYKGVWIELNSPFAYNLMSVMIEPDKDRRIDIPKETIMQYPTPIDGIYRLVIYGENEEFIISDTFIMEG